MFVIPDFKINHTIEFQPNFVAVDSNRLHSLNSVAGGLQDVAQSKITLYEWNLMSWL